MNAAAKMIHQGNFFSGEFADIQLPKQFYWHAVLLVMVLLSALAVAYMTNLHRMSYSQLQSAEQQATQLKLQWGQLLLEQASLVAPARVERRAADTLRMAVPTEKQIILLRAK